jgi:hypothetical protein
LTLDYAALLAAEAASGAAGGGAAAPAAEPGAADGRACGKCPPLPPYSVEGTGGCLITPMAYLVNPGLPGSKLPPPSVGYTFVKVGKTKSVHSFAITETFYRRIELGYSMAALWLGNFRSDVQKVTGVDLDLNTVMLHNFNLRGLLLEETKTMPAVTGGVTFKYNPTVQEIDRRLGGGVRRLGLERSNGTDFTLHATKAIPNVLMGRPVIVTGGMRFSQAAQLGLLGFGDAYRLTGEGSVVWCATDWLAVAYEFRQKRNPYGRLGKLVRGEDNWHTICLAFILNEHLTVATGWGHFGTVANEMEDGVWGVQVKYEF